MINERFHCRRKVSAAATTATTAGAAKRSAAQAGEAMPPRRQRRRVYVRRPFLVPPRTHCSPCVIGSDTKSSV